MSNHIPSLKTATRIGTSTLLLLRINQKEVFFSVTFESFKRFFSRSDQALTETTTVVALAKQNFEVELHVTKGKCSLAEVKHNLQVAHRAVSIPQLSALSKTKKARRCRERFNDAEELLVVP